MNELRIEDYDPLLDVVENGTTEQVIDFAKQFNLFQTGNRVYQERSQLLKDRLFNDGIDWTTLED